jgi:hypothetical protein
MKHEGYFNGAIDDNYGSETLIVLGKVAGKLGFDLLYLISPARNIRSNIL